jgi:hypothetical protein
MNSAAFSKTEIEEIVTLTRLFLYNRNKPCGSKAIRQAMESESIRPLPSLSRIARILSHQGLTYKRTGHYL